MIYTNDGGSTWNDANCYCPYGDVYFTDPLNGWVVGVGGRIRHTHDGGITWEIQNSGTNNYLFGLFATDIENIWAVGENGTILYTNNGGTTGIEVKNTGDSKINIKTYPNPFSNSTTIEYELAKPGTANITIFNHLGQQIESISQRNPRSEKQQHVWDASGLPDGIYFVQVRAGQEMATRKVIKLK